MRILILFVHCYYQILHQLSINLIDLEEEYYWDTLKKIWNKARWTKLWSPKLRFKINKLWLISDYSNIACKSYLLEVQRNAFEIALSKKVLPSDKAEQQAFYSKVNSITNSKWKLSLYLKCKSTPKNRLPIKLKLNQIWTLFCSMRRWKLYYFVSRNAGLIPYLIQRYFEE